MQLTDAERLILRGQWVSSRMQRAIICRLQRLRYPGEFGERSSRLEDDAIHAACKAEDEIRSATTTALGG